MFLTRQLNQSLILLSLVAFIFLSVINAACSSSDRVGVITQNPSSSPIGNTIAFGSDFENPNGMCLWLVNVDGSNLHKITTFSLVEISPVWSPNGKQIAFSADAHIWAVWADGSHLQQLTIHQSSWSLDSRQPSWSPDGSKIAFVSGGDIWIMNADGTSPIRITKMPGQEEHPSFSPSGNEIVFSKPINEKNAYYSTLMIVGVDGSTPVPLTTGNFYDQRPNWGVNGIIFASDRDPPHSKIWTISPNGSNLNKIGDVMAVDPSWLPDGRILYSDEMNGDDNVLATPTIYDPISNSKHSIINSQTWVQRCTPLSRSLPCPLARLLYWIKSLV